jgi:hypothetical protein
MTNLTVADKLLSSCQELHKLGVISKNQYSKCVENIGGGDTFKKIQITEENIFSGSRDSKESKYNEFISSIKAVMDESFNNYKIAKNSEDAEEMEKYEAIIIQIIILMNNVIEWVQGVSLKRHKQKEGGHYDELLFYYNKIDTNRKEFEKINKQILTLKERDIFQGERKVSKTKGYEKARNIFISLIIFIIIALVIIFLIYFI